MTGRVPCPIHKFPIYHTHNVFASGLGILKTTAITDRSVYYSKWLNGALFGMQYFQEVKSKIMNGDSSWRYKWLMNCRPEILLIIQRVRRFTLEKFSEFRQIHFIIACYLTLVKACVYSLKILQMADELPS